MLEETPDNSTQKLALIDKIQRLGVAYHFDDEIETSIQNIFDTCGGQNNYEKNDDNLYVVALRFRLVRQQGHYLSSDVFKKFTNHARKFKETLTNDVKGLLSLYEAAHLRVNGEEILEEALTFTTAHLESMLPSLSYLYKVQVTEALNLPIRKTMRRLSARKYVDVYENIEERDDLLLNFAKLDFNMVQKLHQEELSDLTRCWQELNFANKFPYARDRLVEAYFWIMGMFPEPQYSFARTMLAKIISVITIIDDTFDVYATFYELVLFNDAIERWDIHAMDSLPTYLRPLYQAILNIYNEVEEILTKEGKSNRVHYAKNEMKKVVTSNFKEAEWLNIGYNIPKYEEYMENAMVATATYLIVVTSPLLSMEGLLTNETLEWMTNKPLILRASAENCRLTDDIANYEADHQEGQRIASAVECHMNEHKVSAKEAYVEIQKKIMNSWKDINKELLLHKKVPMFDLGALYYAQVTYTFFEDGKDGYTNSESTTKDLITLLAIEPIKN